MKYTIEELTDYLMKTVFAEEKDKSEFFSVKLAIYLLGIQLVTKKTIIESIEQFDTYDKFINININEAYKNVDNFEETDLLDSLNTYVGQDKDYLEITIFSNLEKAKHYLKIRGVE